jgi:hypothetical protein
MYVPLCAPRRGEQNKCHITSSVESNSSVHFPCITYLFSAGWTRQSSRGIKHPSILRAACLSEPSYQVHAPALLISQQQSAVIETRRVSATRLGGRGDILPEMVVFRSLLVCSGPADCFRICLAGKRWLVGGWFGTPRRFPSRGRLFADSVSRWGSLVVGGREGMGGFDEMLFSGLDEAA